MKGHGSKFERKKEAVIAALLSQKNYEDVAHVAGIDLKTLKRWLRMPEFRSEYGRARWEVVDQAYARAQQNSGAATTVLLRLMADPSTPASSRIRAALGILTLSREALDMEVEARLSALEAANEGNPDRR
jgi:transposase-like protein